MRIVWKVLRTAGLVLLGLLLVVVISTSLILNLNPAIGTDPDESAQLRYMNSGHFENGKFFNPQPTDMNMTFGDAIRLINLNFFDPPPNRTPDHTLPSQTIDSLYLVNKPAGLERLTWFGHSACLLEVDGKKIFFDPMLGQYAGPISFMSPKRFDEKLPIEVEQLPYLDAVVFSHDHYDHLDYDTVMKLKDKVGHFFVPLGVGSHLIGWGIDPSLITELDWWQSETIDDLTFTCTPARHFSGRGMFNRFSTLWGSWVVKTPNSQVYFSGDSGYGPHFKEIGDRFGEFDLVMMECGQYNELWHDIHMMPEETVQAGVDVNAKLLMPIHWGSFTLALHSWTDPADRATAAAVVKGLPLTTPIIGEPVILHGDSYPHDAWWH